MIPTKIAFVLFNNSMMAATGLTNKEVISITLTEEQRQEIKYKIGQGREIFESYIINS